MPSDHKPIFEVMMTQGQRQVNAHLQRITLIVG